MSKAGFPQRRERFLSGTRVDTAAEAGIEPALMILRAEIEAVAAAKGMPAVPAGVMNLMLSAGQHDLKSLKAGDLKGFRPGSALVTRVASESFGRLFSGMTADQMRTYVQTLGQASAAGEVGLREAIHARGDVMRGSGLRGQPGGRNRESADGVGAELPGSYVTSSYAKAYAGSGVDPSTVKLFGEVGLNRRVYEGLRQEGYGREQIEQGAKSAKRLGWHGATDNQALVHIGPEGQKLTEETDKLADQGRMDEARRKFEEMRQRRDETADPRVRGGYDHVMDKLKKEHKELREEAAPEAKRTLTDAQLLKIRMDRSENVATVDGVQKNKVLENADAATIKKMQMDAFGVSAEAPKQAEAPKPAEPVKVGAVKPAVKSAGPAPA
jgi:hypothetical protein